MNISSDIKQSAVDYSINSISYICTEIGGRASGSPEEKKAQEWMAEELKTNNWADEVKIEEFKVASKAFLSYTKFVPLLVILTIAIAFVDLITKNVNFVGKVISIVIIVGCLLSVVLEFGMYKQFLDPLFKKTMSHNVIGIKKPEDETKRRIIFSGHCDSSYEWTLFRKGGMPLFIGAVAYSIIGALAMIGLYIAAIIVPDVIALYYIPFAFVPGFILLYFFCNYEFVVPGANDNLTGALCAMSVLKCLKESGIALKNTEVQCLLTGSEEAGLRGAKAWVKKHANEDKDIETVFIGLETLRDNDFMSVYVRDLSGMVKHSDKAVKLLDKAALGLEGKVLPHASVYVGASDAAALTQAGMHATCLASMDPAPARYYHTREDNEKNMDADCFKRGLDMALAALDIFDKEGLE